ncbi:MAG: NAD(P)-binding domain-containing protein [Proteobacteria bacterium]|nr:NAD(P)-binding domain-containing protein [Pseudomonadota bacterium]
MKIAILGTGQVGEVLANGFLKHGYAVMRGSREPAKLEKWKSTAMGEASIGTFADAAKWGEVVVLAVKGVAAESAVDLAGVANLAGKPVLDATNPIAELPPVNGVIQFFTGPNESLMEKLQAKAPAAHFVKCFSCVGNAFMIDPAFAQKPTMFICGNDAEAKQTTTAILTKVGWETADFGAVESARAIEPLCMLWCIPGMRGGSWTHAFKLLQLG